MAALCRKAAMKLVAGEHASRVSITERRPGGIFWERPQLPTRSARHSTEQVGRSQWPGLDRCGRRRLLEVEVNVVARQRQAGAHRQPGRRDEGVGPRSPQLYPQPGRTALGIARRFLQERGTSMSTSPKGRSRRTALPRASRSPRPWCPL